jgi:SOS-response transcriptional repressor LexA
LTAAKDRTIRDWLRANGYEVIEITATELHDPGAMQRRFKRLANLLGAAEVREKVKSNTTWFDRAAEAGDAVVQFVLRKVQPTPEQRFKTCVPLVPLKAAAGAFSDPQRIDADDWEWVEVQGRTLRPGMFVAQVVGKSMEPAIPDGAHCLFRTPVEGSRQGKTVLVQLRDQVDPESGERYTVKRYSSDKSTDADGTWRHVKVTLKPNNPAFAPIELTTDDEGTVAVAAELVAVLG